MPVFSVGAGLRILLAYIPLEFYAAKPFQRPTQGWVPASTSLRAGSGVNPAEFERLVEEALDSLPERFAELLENVVVVVEEEPSASDLDVL